MIYTHANGNDVLFQNDLIYTNCMFSFLQKNSRKEEVTLCVYTVNSYAVSAAVVRTYHREGATPKPVVLFSYEEKIPLYHKRDAETLEQLIFTHTKNVLGKCRSFHANFDRVVCTIGEPWVTTFSRSVHFEKKEPFKITQKVIDEMVARDMRLFEQEVIRDYRSLEEMGVVGTVVPAVDVNGYRISDYVGTMAKALDVSVTVSIAPVRFIEQLLSISADTLRNDDIFCQAENTARAHLFTKMSKATVLDIGGVTSTFSIIDRGCVTYTASVPSGLVSFENNLEALFDVRRVQIDSVMQFAEDEKFIEHHRDTYYKRISAAHRDLGVMLRRGIDHMKKYTQAIPHPIYIVANPAWVSVLHPVLRSDMETDVVIPREDTISARIVYTSSAHAKSLPLSLAILQATENAS